MLLLVWKLRDSIYIDLKVAQHLYKWNNLFPSLIFTFALLTNMLCITS